MTTFKRPKVTRQSKKTYGARSVKRMTLETRGGIKKRAVRSMKAIRPLRVMRGK